MNIVLPVKQANDALTPAPHMKLIGLHMKEEDLFDEHT